MEYKVMPWHCLVKQDKTVLLCISSVSFTGLWSRTVFLFIPSPHVNVSSGILACALTWARGTHSLAPLADGGEAERR